MSQEEIEDAKVIEMNQVEETQNPRLDEYDFNKLKTIFNKRNEQNNALLNIAYSKRNVLREEKKVHEILDSIDAEQETLMKELEAKYGQIQINPETGEFILMQPQ